MSAHGPVLVPRIERRNCDPGFPANTFLGNTPGADSVQGRPTPPLGSALIGEIRIGDAARARVHRWPPLPAALLPVTRSPRFAPALPDPVAGLQR